LPKKERRRSPGAAKARFLARAADKVEAWSRLGTPLTWLTASIILGGKRRRFLAIVKAETKREARKIVKVELTEQEHDKDGYKIDSAMVYGLPLYTRDPDEFRYVAHDNLMSV